MYVYHGSPAKFEAFDYAKVGTQGTAEGKGFYFTDSELVARTYGRDGFLYKVEWLGKKSLSSTEMTISRQDFGLFLKKMDEENEYLSNWGDVACSGQETVLEWALEGEYDSSENDVDLISGVSNASGDLELTLRLLHEMFGYDSIIASPEWGGTQTIYIALVPKAFKIESVVEVK